MTQIFFGRLYRDHPVFIQQIQMYLFIHLNPSALIVMLQSLFPFLFQI
jgi:hypothetical protein